MHTDIPRRITILFLFFSFLFLSPSPAEATPEYSSRTGQSCKTCHIKGHGGPLSEKGLEFAASGYLWPPEGGYRVLGPIRKSVRFVIGFFHVVAAFMWFGTILYVHILLRPAYASKGLPKGEMFLGLLSMMTVGITGVLLTVSRVRSWNVLFGSPWGATLSVKILLYLSMVASAVFVITFVGPRLKSGARVGSKPKNGMFDPMTLASHDGKEGRRALVAVRGKVYDVTDLKLWKNGSHMNHTAGSELTAAIGRAPHDEDKLNAAVVAGTYDETRQPPKTTAQKLFYFIAYMNLALVFIVLLVIAYWRWGIG